MFIPAVSENKVSNWEDYTLIVPVVSVGNVGQLTADLVISTLGMDYIGFMYHEAITPAVGSNPFQDTGDNSNNLTSCCQVYSSPSKHLMVIQQRAPLVKGRVKAYVASLSSWIRQKQFRRIVIVGSTFSHERLDAQLHGSPFRLVMTEPMRKMGQDLTALKVKEMEARPNLMTDRTDEASSDGVTGALYLPGSGIARRLLESCHDLPVVLFLMFCSEGDNACDAVAMAQQLNRWLHLTPSTDQPDGGSQRERIPDMAQWKVPSSWKHFYGTNFDKTLFH